MPSSWSRISFGQAILLREHRHSHLYRNSRSNGRPVPWSRLDRQLPFDQSQPLSHTDQPQSLTLESVGIEPSSRIPYDQLDVSGGSRQRDVALTRPAIF